MGEDQGGVSRVVRAGFWIYWSSIANNVSGFIYWLIITKVAGSEILGLTSATIGLATLVSGLIDLGVLAGVQRFLGKWWVRDRGEFAEYLWSTFLLKLAVNLAVGSALLLIGVAGVSISHYTPRMFELAGVLVILSTLGLFGSYFSSILRTDILFISSLVGNTAKILAGLLLVWMGYGFTGAVAGFILLNIVSGLIGFMHAVKLVGFRLVARVEKLREVVSAGLASWIPGLVAMLGMWIGVLAVFGSSGAVSTGYYYVAYALFSVISMIGTSIVGLLLPYLSSLEEGRERIASRVVSLTLVLVTPLVYMGLLYGRVPLSILGSEYVNATPILAVLLVASIPILIVGAVGNLVYAIGDYKRVLYIGLWQNIPRIILYLILVPLYHGLGAAASFTLGALAAIPYSLQVGSEYGFRVDSRRIIELLAVPGITAGIAYAAGLDWIIGSLLIASSYLAYGRLGLLTRRDARMLALAFFSEEKLNAYYSRVKGLVDFILPG